MWQQQVKLGLGFRGYLSTIAGTPRQPSQTDCRQRLQGCKQPWLRQHSAIACVLPGHLAAHLA